MKEINNALAPHEFEELQKYIMGHEIPWYHYEHLTYPPTLPEFNENHDKKRIEETKKLFSKGMTKEQQMYNHYMCHIVYINDKINSEFVFQKLKPLIDLINPITLIRIKINNYPQTPTVIHHQDHVDGNYKHKGALFYVNTNNGATVIENKEVASVENKLVLFDSSKIHHSTSTSDTSRRITINVNYF